MGNWGIFKKAAALNLAIFLTGTYESYQKYYVCLNKQRVIFHQSIGMFTGLLP